MTVPPKIVRQSRLGIACFVFISTIASLTVLMTASMVFAQSAPYMSVGGDTSLLRVQKTMVQPDLLGELFPVGPITNPTTPNPVPNPEPGTGTPGTGTIPGTGTTPIPNCGFSGICDPSTGGGSWGGGWGGNNGGWGSNGGWGTGGWPGTYDPRKMSRATMMPPEYQCNLFENPPMGEVVAALSALSSVTVGPACEGKVDMAAVGEDRKRIYDVVVGLRKYLDNPDTVTKDSAPDIGNQVQIAIQSASNIASTFSNTALSDKCRSGMSAGKIASSINSVINGLTPFAMMAATMPGGAAAIPFVVGGTIISSAIDGMAKIIDQKTVDINDQVVRQAIIENTCQYIRLEQKYRFLSQASLAQAQKRVTDDINMSESLFSAKIKVISPQANGLVMRRNAIDKTMLEINKTLEQTTVQFTNDKSYFDTTPDAATQCTFGVLLAKDTENKTSPASIMLGSLDQAMAVYGKNSGLKAATLKSNANVAVTDLKNFAAKPSHTAEETQACANTSKYFVKAVEDSATVAKQLLKTAKTGVEIELEKTKDFGFLKASIGNLDQRRVQANRVVDFMETMKATGEKVSRSEIDESMRKIRQSLFSRSMVVFKSPVIKWFNHVEGLHNSAVTQFSKGLDSLRLRAFTLTASGKGTASNKTGFTVGSQLSKDRADSQQLLSFNLKNVPLDTRVHEDVCRELNGVYDQWVVVTDHLGAMTAFCDMIEPYILDSREDDKELVTMCRSDRTKLNNSTFNINAPAHVVQMKMALINDRKRDWAAYLKRKIDELVCINPTIGK